MIHSKIDLRNFKEFQPGNIIKLKYFEYYGRNTFEPQRWVIETVFQNVLYCNRICENGAIIRECFNIGTLIEGGVLIEQEEIL